MSRYKEITSRYQDAASAFLAIEEQEKANKNIKDLLTDVMLEEARNLKSKVHIAKALYLKGGKKSLKDAVEQADAILAKDNGVFFE